MSSSHARLDELPALADPEKQFIARALIQKAQVELHSALSEKERVSALIAQNRAQIAQLEQRLRTPPPLPAASLWNLQAPSSRVRWDHNRWFVLPIFCGIVTTSLAFAYALKWLWSLL